MATGLPSQTQVIELLDGEFARAGYDIEGVVIDARSQPPRITVIADGDNALDLDAVANLSRSAAELLDADIPGSYVLEVSSPGVDRPLTNEKHFRRARGRKVDVALTDGATLTGRVGATRDGAVDLVVRAGKDWSTRPVPIGDITKAVVQVEFSPPPQREMELATGEAEKEGRT